MNPMRIVITINSYLCHLQFGPEQEGQYFVTVPASNLICNSDNVTFTITLLARMHPGWISSISFGCFAFLLLIATIALGVRAYRMKGREGKNQRLELKTAGGKPAIERPSASNGFCQTPGK